MGILENILNANNLQKENKELESKELELTEEVRNLKLEIAAHQENLESADKEKEMNSQRYQELLNQMTSITEIVENYELRFGKIELQNENEVFLNDFDTDIAFFERLEQVMGNPFNREQVSAIRYDMDKNLRIIAGAGSGKTQTICAKAAYLAQMENVDQSRIMMITFTKNAADELEERVGSFLGTGSTKIAVGTFHRIFGKLFSDAQSKFPYLKKISNSSQFLDDKAKNRAMTKLIDKYKLRLLDETGERNLNGKLDYWFSMDLDHRDVLKIVEENYNELEPENSGVKIHERLQLLLEEFDEYKKEEGVKEFNDILNNFKMAMEYQEVRDYITSKYEYLFIDEFQDTNPVQWNIVKKMCENTIGGRQIKLIVVGDDDQSIYYFRGAEPKYIKTFDQQFPTHTIELMTNYRSKANIVKAANRLIANNFNDRIQKSMVPHDSSDGQVLITRLADPEQEATWIIDQVIKLGTGKVFKGSALSDITESVVLYRSSAQLASIIQTLIRRRIDFVIETDNDFKGIFDLPLFKNFFFHLRALYSSKTDIERLNTKFHLISNIFMLFYLSKKSIEEFRFSPESKNKSEGVADYILKNVKFTSMDKVEIVRLFELINLGAEDKDADISQLFILFTKISRVKKELSEEERTWIIEDTKKLRSWKELEQHYKELVRLSKEMKEKVRLYHDNKLNALYLLTIHKSKGLAYTNVFIPCCTEGGLPNRKAILKTESNVEQEIIDADPATTFEEERRLMYVAMTRARKNLYLTLPSEMKNKPIKLSRFLQETGI